MTQDHYAVYHFMVSKFGGNQFSSAEEFFQGIKQNLATKRFVPSKVWGVYNLDTQTLMAEGYYCRYGFDLIKVKEGIVREYYRRLISEKNYAFVAYNLDSLEPIEYYKNMGKQELKFDWYTNEKKQVNNFCDYLGLPEGVRLAIKKFQFKYSVFAYSNKPYGRIVEFNFPK